MQIRENEELLKNAVELGIMDIEEIATAVEEMRRKEVLKKHKFKIWQDNKGRYLTYIQPEGEERMIRRRKTKEELENLLIEFYAAEDENIVIKDVFEEWINQKLENREVKKQSYDRYFSDFKKYLNP